MRWLLLCCPHGFDNSEGLGTQWHPNDFAGLGLLFDDDELLLSLFVCAIGVQVGPPQSFDIRQTQARVAGK